MEVRIWDRLLVTGRIKGIMEKMAHRRRGVFTGVGGVVWKIRRKWRHVRRRKWTVLN